jgi:hypothetical protein
VAGPIYIYGGVITLNGNLTTTALGSSILAKATGDIVTNSGRAFQTNNGDFILWADSDNSNGGRIWLYNNNTINTANGSTTSGLTGGGKIVLGGGLDDGANGGVANDGIPDGFATSSSAIGVLLGETNNANHTQLYSGGGDIIVRGSSTRTTADLNGSGLWSYGRWSANSGKGAIIINGSSASFRGINFTDESVDAIKLQLISDKASGTAISIIGTSNSNNEYGITFNRSNFKEVLATGGGNIYVNGTAANTTKTGVFLQDVDILASSGTITLDTAIHNPLNLQLNGSPIYSTNSVEVWDTSYSKTDNCVSWVVKAKRELAMFLWKKRSGGWSIVDSANVNENDYDTLTNYGTADSLRIISTYGGN